LDLQDQFLEPDNYLHLPYAPSPIWARDRWYEAVRTNEKVKQTTRDLFLEKVDRYADLTRELLGYLSAPDLVLMSEQEARQKLESIVQKLRAQPAAKKVSVLVRPPEKI
jgi:hypothetical protein